MFWNDESIGTRQPPSIVSSTSLTQIKNISIYACKLPFDHILNQLGQSLNNSLGLFQILLGTGSFQKAEHHFIICETNRGTFIVSQKYFNGDLILREYSNLQECLQAGIDCSGRTVDNSTWQICSFPVAPHTTIQSLIDFYNGRKANYILQNANCQHYSLEWTRHFKY